MKFDAKKINDANVDVVATIESKIVEAQLELLAKQASKTMDVQGFRKGKVPLALVKQRYGDKLKKDAQNEALRILFNEVLAELKIDNKDLMGEPSITKFDEQENSDIDVKFEISIKPKVELGDYKKLLPEIKEKTVTAKEIDAKLEEMAKGSAPLGKIARKRKAKAGDFAIIDFEGFKDGVAFAGGKAEKHTLEIGSNSFIPGFEDQVIGMSYDEDKEINVTFPKEYQSTDLAGAEVVFKVKLHEIHEKKEAVLDDEFAKKVMPGEKDITLEILKDKIKENIKAEKMNAYYTEELKPAYVNDLVSKIDFDVPEAVLRQEIDQALNVQIKAMSEEEVEKLKNDKDQIKKMQEEARPEAIKSVKATFIVDALAKSENISVTDEEVSQVIYYEAMMSGQDGQAMIKQYQEAGYLPAIKMSMLENKTISMLLDGNRKTKKASTKKVEDKK